MVEKNITLSTNSEAGPSNARFRTATNLNSENQLSSIETDAPEASDAETQPPVLGRAKSRFKQQTLPAWQPLYNVGSLYWKFLILGLVYIPLGILLNLSSSNLTEIEVGYTDCISLSDPGKTCADIIQETPGAKCNCEAQFTIDKDIDTDIYMYYALTNFFQNHRMYVKSRDNNQLLGKIGDENQLEKPNDDCEHYDYREEEGIRKIIFPCGAIANSLFNDSITLYRIENEMRVPILLKRTGIAWESDKKYKFKNPKFGPSHTFWRDNFTHPPDWGRTIWDLDPINPDNNGLQNEDFIVWMRTAALSNFRKPYRIINEPKLLKGAYVLQIEYSYKTKSFGGTKSIVLCTHSSLMGSKNLAIGIVYSSMGGVAVVIALIFLYIYIRANQRRNLDLEEFQIVE